MKEKSLIKDKLAKLIEVKKLIAIIFSIAFVVEVFRGNIGSSNFIQIVSIIVAFYFGQSSVRQTINENK